MNYHNISGFILQAFHKLHLQVCYVPVHPDAPDRLLPVGQILKPEDKKWLAEIGEKLHTEWHMFPDRDAPGESLFMQLKEILPQLVHHQLPPECKDFSEYYLKKKK